MARQSKEEFLRRWRWPQRSSAALAPARTDTPKDYSQLSDEELTDAIKDQERKVREARELELAAYQADEQEEPRRMSMSEELRKRGIKPQGRHW
jgi:hypothetical protein